MPLPRLYTELAHLWPSLSPPEDYADEARAIRHAIFRRLGAAAAGAGAVRRPALLEFGTGGGHTLSHLKADFDCVALDIAQPMLANARRLNPEVEHHCGDMRTWRIDRLFDVVLVHDAIDYMTTAADVGLVLANARRHLKPGGLVLFAPSSVVETWTADELAVDQQPGPDGSRLTYVSYAYDPDPADTSIRMVMLLLIRRGAEMRIERDDDELGLFTIDQWVAMLEDAGFEAAVEPLLDQADEGPQPLAPLFIGRLPEASAWQGAAPPPGVCIR